MVRQAQLCIRGVQGISIAQRGFLGTSIEVAEGPVDTLVCLGTFLTLFNLQSALRILTVQANTALFIVTARFIFWIAPACQ